MDLRVLIVAEQAAADFAGEGGLALHYYRVLRKRNIPTWLITHARNRAGLMALFPNEADRILFVPDTAAHRLLWRIGQHLPDRVSTFSVGFVMRLVSQLHQRRMIRRLVREEHISVIHQPMPVSPKEPSMIFGMGVPVVIGPMNGGMNYPPAFRKVMESRGERLAMAAGRRLANLMNLVIPGKRRAAMLLVANQRTRDALPDGVCGRVETLVENGVDLSLWSPMSAATRGTSSSFAKFVFLGRFVRVKAIDLLLLAFKRASAQAPMSLTLIGDGVERTRLEQLAQRLELFNAGTSDVPGQVRITGWKSQMECAIDLRHSDALVLPSLKECGGAVVLEAMAMEIPVIATAWGGPADYLDASCGILIEPTSREALVEGLASALGRIARSSEDRVAMGKAGRAKVIQYFDWEVKVDRMLAVYRQVVSELPTGRESVA